MATKRDKERLERLDREIAALKVGVGIDMILGRVGKTELEYARLEALDKKRAALRARIKKYTGDGVGGSARRLTSRSVGSSPTPPTTQGEA